MKSEVRVTMHTNYEKFSIKLETDEGIEEILYFLSQKDIELTSDNEKRIIKRLRLVARRLGLKNFTELLNRLKSDTVVYDNLLMWLEKGKIFNENDQSFSPLIKRKKSLKEYAQISQNSTKKLQRNRTVNSKVIVEGNGFEPKLPGDDKNINLIFEFLASKNINYQAYKPNHFLRRLHTRMRKANSETYKEYHSVLQSNPREFNLLMDNFSINVTRFFRDNDLFKFLEKKILPKIFSLGKKSVRIWSAGCAIGPEPYSIAMLIEEIQKRKGSKNFFLLATDINRDLLLKAKQGFYSDKYLEEIDAQRLQAYFNYIDSETYQLSSQIREAVTFQQHDLRTPPPARDFDLILCRNVLIYFSRPQSEVFFQRFYSALKPHGYLVLGKCEVLPQSIKSKFEIIDTRTRIYRRKD
jgi:chemotaxis protein methyltransferase CheR